MTSSRKIPPHLQGAAPLQKLAVVSVPFCKIIGSVIIVFNVKGKQKVQIKVVFSQLVQKNLRKCCRIILTYDPQKQLS